MRNVAVRTATRSKPSTASGSPVNNYAVNISSKSSNRWTTTPSTTIETYLDLYDVAAEFARTEPRNCRRSGTARFSMTAASRFTTNFEDLSGLRQLPGSPCAAMSGATASAEAIGDGTMVTR
jgi:L-arabinose isomerase